LYFSRDNTPSRGVIPAGWPNSLWDNWIRILLYYDKASKRACLVPTVEFYNPRVYWSAVKPSGKCDGPTPLGGMMNIRYPKDLGGGLWSKMKQVAMTMGVNTNFTYVYCRQYQGMGSKIRFNFVVTESSSAENVSSGWWPDAGTMCIYDVPMY